MNRISVKNQELYNLKVHRFVAEQELEEIDLMKEQTGEYPLLLLDDVLSELDTIRQTHLLTAIQNKVQTFLTTTSLSDVARQLINEPTIFEIEHGTLNKEEVK